MKTARRSEKLSLPSASPEQINETKAGNIGAQVRSARRARNMTLDNLADATGLDRGYLSRIERDEKSPSIATVIKIAQALKTSVATLFGETIDDAAIHFVPAKSRRMLAPTSEKGSNPFAALSKSCENNKIESFIIFPSSEFGPDGYNHHGGEEVLFVLRGKVEVNFSDRSVAISQGDYLQFPGHLKHQIRRIGLSAEVLVVIALD
jgi:transcriptional regulator with XRE-family HTH domain